MVELYLLFPIRFHDMVSNYLKRRDNFTFTLAKCEQLIGEGMLRVVRTDMLVDAEVHTYTASVPDR
jgi:hypothetical protein